MKPTPQISVEHRKRRDFPLTDYQYQTSALSAGRAIRKKTLSALELKTFRKLSAEFFANETPRIYIAELFLFILITGIAAWPIISSMIAITRLVRNY